MHGKGRKLREDLRVITALTVLINFIVIWSMAYAGYHVAFSNVYPLSFSQIGMLTCFFLACGFSPSSTKKPHEMAEDRFLFNCMVLVIFIGLLIYEITKN